MKWPNCQKVTNVSKVKVEELGKKVIFLNASRRSFCKTKVDGCIKKTGKAADWIVSEQGVGDVIIELKGKNVEHAAKQILETAVFWRANGCDTKIGALIICSQYPRVNTSIQRAANIFMKQYKGPLHVVSRNAEFLFAKVLSFDGPF